MYAEVTAVVYIPGRHICAHTRSFCVQARPPLLCGHQASSGKHSNSLKAGVKFPSASYLAFTHGMTGDSRYSCGSGKYYNMSVVANP